MEKNVGTDKRKMICGGEQKFDLNRRPETILLWGVSDANRIQYEKLAALLKTEYTDISLVVVSADARIEAGADYTFYYYDVCGRELSYAQLDGYDEVYPIDEDLLKKMDVYLPEILKMMDRLNIVSFERRWRLYIDILEYWNSYLDKQNIVYYIHFNVPHEVTDYIIYSLCKVKGINYVGYSYFFYA